MKVDGAIVKKRRKERHMTQKELAEGICKQATISNIENKNRVNSLSILVQLCVRLDLPIDHVTQKR